MVSPPQNLKDWRRQQNKKETTYEKR